MVGRIAGPAARACRAAAPYEIGYRFGLSNNVAHGEARWKLAYALPL